MDTIEENVTAWFRALGQALATNDGSRSYIECLNAANRQSQGEDFQGMIQTVTDVVMMGMPLSRAMGLFPDVFTVNHVTVVRYGEMYGELDATLLRYAEHPEDRAARCRRPTPV